MNSCIFLLLISCLCNNNCGMSTGNCVQNHCDCNHAWDDKCMCENNSNVRGDDCECEHHHHHHHHHDTDCGCDIPQAWQRGNDDCDRNTGGKSDDRRTESNDCGCMSNNDMRMTPPPIRNNDCSCNR